MPLARTERLHTPVKPAFPNRDLLNRKRQPIAEDEATINFREKGFMDSLQRS